MRVPRRTSFGAMASIQHDPERLSRYWDKQVGSYDRQMRFVERRMFSGTREWVCSRATGQTLEVAVGTGLNLRSYPEDVELTGIDLSPGMLERARERADALGRSVTLGTGDAQRLEFPDDSFDTVVCTFSLCSVPDDRAALAEIWRVLRPGGRLVLADHVVSTALPVRFLQAVMEFFTVRIGAENYRRRPVRHVRNQGFVVDEQERFRLGIIERLRAHKPADR